jgi:transcriptional regulator with XRE-family HTH domain
VIIGDRLRTMREEKHFSQGDIEKKTGLLRCYISRVENGHTVPAIETLEKMARALEVPMYQLFYDGEEPPKLPNLPQRKSSDAIPGAVRGRMHGIWVSFGVYWRGLRMEIASSFYTWPRKWQERSLVERGRATNCEAPG